MARNLKDNPFLVLGVSADAEMSEIKQVAQRSLMELRLDGEEKSEAARRIEMALETLQDPVQRFHWGLFWPELTPRETLRFRKDPILSTLAQNPLQNAHKVYQEIAESPSSDIRSHNAGVLALLRAVAMTEQAQKGTPDDTEDDIACASIWKHAFQCLQGAAGSQQFWVRQQLRAKELHDPRLNPELVAKIREGFLGEAIAPVGTVITTALLAGHADVATVYVDLLRQSDFAKQYIEDTLSNVYKPLADRVEQNITQLEERLEQIKTTSPSDSTIVDLLNSFKAQVLPDLNVMLKVGDLPGYAEEHARDTAAEFLRSLAIMSWNTTGKSALTNETLKLAERFADADSIISRVREDQAQIKRIESEEHEHDLELNIRSDSIVITESGIQYNNQNITAEELWGLRFGVFVQYTNGAKSSSSYRVDYRSRKGTVINIECKRMFRSETKAEADFQAILDATLHQLAPGLIDRVSDAVVAGTSYDMRSGCMLTNSGVQFSTGMLMWKTAHTIPYNEAEFITAQGAILISSSRVKNAQITLSLRDNWNAVMFKHIANAILRKL